MKIAGNGRFQEEAWEDGEEWPGEGFGLLGLEVWKIGCHHLAVNTIVHRKSAKPALLRSVCTSACTQLTRQDPRTSAHNCEAVQNYSNYAIHCCDEKG